MKNPGVQYGLYFGFTIIAILYILYLINPVYYVGYYTGVIFIISIYFLYQTAQAARITLGGYIQTKEAFIPCFSTWFIGTLMASIFSYVFINFIDPSLKDIMIQHGLESVEQTKDYFNEDFSEIMKESLENEGIDMSIGRVLASWLMSLIIGAFLSFVFALIVRKYKLSDS